MYTSIVLQAALLSVAQAHGVILAAQGLANSPTSIGFKVDDGIARNCTGISPCQQDTTIIRDAEIKANIVNECGRTELSGNIDVGESTENAISANAVTQVKAGTLMTVTIHQVNADGAGPYFCDLDETSNAGVISQNLVVTNNVPGVNGLSQAKTEDFNITVQMPDNLACTGGSTGNICTVRCRNNAVAGPFGGCIAVQQTDIAASNNTPNSIKTAGTLKGIQAQVQQDNADFPAAVAANQAAGSAEGVKSINGANGIFYPSPRQKHQTNSRPAILSATQRAKAAAANANANATANANFARRNAHRRSNNNKARGSSLRWASRLFSSDSWKEPSN
ncbi:hypothetical protein NHQ30_004934 [Ciborinia camelliae]|nr:hypothetical protein NHQ30_004934 [Ciborinia camelliae]